MAKKGCIPWNKGLTKDTDERVRKLGLSLKRHLCYKGKERNIKIGLAMKGNKNGFKKGQIPWNFNKTKETDERVKQASKNISKIKKGKKRKSFTEKHRENIGLANKGHIVIEETRKKIKLKVRKNWKDPEYQKKQKEARQTTPNKPEQLLIKLFKQHNLPYKYVGDNSLRIDGLCPDFIHHEQKKLIEYNGYYYHRVVRGFLKGLKRDREKLRRYKKEGYKVLVFWDKDLKNLNRLVNKIKEFNNKP